MQQLFAEHSWSISASEESSSYPLFYFMGLLPGLEQYQSVEWMVQLPSPGRKALSSAGPLCVQAQAGAAAPATLTLAPFTFLLFLYVHTGPARPVCGLLMLLFSSAVPARSIVPSGNYSLQQWPWAPPAQYLPHPLASPNAVPEPSDHISLCLFLASSLSHVLCSKGVFQWEETGRPLIYTGTALLKLLWNGDLGKKFMSCFAIFLSLCSWREHPSDCPSIASPTPQPLVTAARVCLVGRQVKCEWLSHTDHGDTFTAEVWPQRDNRFRHRRRGHCGFC